MPGTTVMMSGAEARMTGRSVAAHTTPPQPLTRAALNGGFEHDRAAGCMDRQVPHAEGAEHGACTPNGVRDVVQLYIKEHCHTEVSHRANCSMSSRAKELQTDFRNSDVWLYRLSNRYGAAQV